MIERLTEHIGHYVRIVGCKTLYSPMERKEAPASSVVARLAAYEDAMTLERAQELAQAEKDGRLVVLDEDVALAMSAGSRAILNNKRLQGVTYMYDCFGEFGGPKEISYLQAAEILYGIGSTYLTREEADMARRSIARSAPGPGMNATRAGR